jgi:hypothetical protein
MALNVRVLLTTAAVLTVAACGRATPPAADAAAPAASPSPTTASQKPADPQPPAGTAVEFEKLIALLPEASGWTRGTPRGEQVNMGTPVSHARAKYERGDGSVDLEITDSSFNQLVLSPLTMYLGAGFSEKTSDGYTKSARVSGHPGFEKWNHDAARAEIVVVVRNRFIVRGTGHNVENADPVRAIVRAVDFSRFAALK